MKVTRLQIREKEPNWSLVAEETVLLSEGRAARIHRTEYWRVQRCTERDPRSLQRALLQHSAEY